MDGMKLFAIYLVVMNVLGVVVMWSDKRRARLHRWRIPEKVLFGVSLLQNEAACGKTLPCTYELCMTDASGNAVSDVVTVAVDRQSENPQERVIKIRFSLKTDCAFSSKEPYFLVARDAQTGVIVWREEYKINIAFAPGVDFGF